MTNRTQLLMTLREATKGDLWLTTYALFSLTEDVDLSCLIGLVETVLDAAEGRDEQPTALRALLAERWSITK